ncbi:uncharacterized protein [Macaca fascicularis]|uniref:uncharacterized protein n=1 Tax=Macaca fascicularis TaxID=9541 RepID=UPI003D15415D
MGKLRPAAGTLHRARGAAPEWSGRQGALRAGLGGRKRWQLLGRVKGGKGKITGLGGGKDCVTGRKALETVESGRRRRDPIPGAGRATRDREAQAAPHRRQGLSRRCRRLERASRPGAVPPRGGRRAGRGGAPSARLREAVRAGAGRVRPPGAAGRAAFLMCHQHVEPGRAAASKRTLPQLSRGLAIPLLSRLRPARSPSGGGSGGPQVPGRSSETTAPGQEREGLPERRGAGPGSRLRPQCPGGGAGSAVREGAACGERLAPAPAPRPAPLAPRHSPAELSAGNRGGAELGLAGAAWERGEVSRRVTLAPHSGVGLWWGGFGPRTSPSPSAVPRPAPRRPGGGLEAAERAKRRVTLRGLGLEPATRGRAGQWTFPGDAA